MNTANGREVGESVNLTCWKEISDYLGKATRTVQRWEKERGLPVRRPLGAGHKSAVLTSKGELDHWLKTSWHLRLPSDGPGKRPVGNALAGNPVLRENIECLRELRHANHALALEVRVAIDSLNAQIARYQSLRPVA